MYLKSGSSLTLHAQSLTLQDQSQDSSKFRVYLTTPTLWNQCLESDYQDCLIYSNFEYTNLQQANIDFKSMAIDTVLVMRSENLQHDIEIDYKYTYSLLHENVIIRLMTIMALITPFIIVIHFYYNNEFINNKQ